MHTHMYIHIHTYTYVHIHTHIHIHIRIHMHTHIRLHVYMHIHVSYTHVYIHTHMYTYILENGRDRDSKLTVAEFEHLLPHHHLKALPVEFPLYTEIQKSRISKYENSEQNLYTQFEHLTFVYRNSELQNFKIRNFRTEFVYRI